MRASINWRLLVLVALTFVLSSVSTRAQDHVPVDDMGKFLGHTVLCGCLPFEDDHLLAVYFALMVEWEGDSYADAASGYMQLVRDKDYRNQATFCSIICDHEFTTYLTDVVSMVDLDTEPATFIASYNGYRDAHGAGTAAGGTSGVYQGAVEEELPECSATEDLYPGVGCEGRRRSRINGY